MFGERKRNREREGDRERERGHSKEVNLQKIRIKIRNLYPLKTSKTCSLKSTKMYLHLYISDF